MEEEMVGWFLPGQVPSSIWDDDGGPPGAVECRLRIRLNVSDLNEFIDGSAHEAQVAGSLSISEFDGIKGFELEIDELHSRFELQQLDQSSNEAHLDYRLRFVPEPDRQLEVRGFKTLRKDGAGDRREMREDYATFYGSLNERDSETKQMGAIYLKSKTAGDLVVLGNLNEFLQAWRVTGTDDRLLQLQAKMRFLAFAGRFLRMECDPALEIRHFQ